MKWNRARPSARRWRSAFGRERWNEHVKLIAMAMNGVAVASVIGGFIAPLVNPIPPSLNVIPLLFGAGVVLHLAAHEVMRYYRGKE